jgi:DnaJ-class molecular chaperone
MFSRQGGGGGGRGFSGKGSDIRARLEIDLEDAVRGALKRITFGDGRTLEVSIPKGAAEGQVLRLRGQGHPGRAGAGDALIELVIREHPVFRKEGADLHMDLPVSVPDAVLGAKVDAPTPEGVVSLVVPRRANSGAVLRLKGRGAVDPATGRRGDLLARVVVTLPEGPDPELDRIAEIWRKERPYTPRRRS